RKSMMSEKILVVGEANEGELRNVSFEVIAAARQIKEDAEVVGLLLGDGNLEEEANEMIKYGADRMITVTHENLKEYTSEEYGQAILEILEEQDPYDFILGHTSTAKDVSLIYAVCVGLDTVNEAM